MRRLTRAIKKEMDLGWGNLGTVTLGLTYRCNLRCSMCGTWQKGAERSRDELTMEEISRILDEARALGGRELILVGAEPLTREDLPDIVRDAKQRGFPVHIVTNGTLLTPALSSELVAAGLDRATVSIDGPPEIHDKVRGRAGVFELAAQGVRNLKVAKKEAGSSTPLIGMHCTISSTSA
ncbi:radical SAM protein, partial [bacterium]|nr:radical SAM protein [bacterium]